LLKIISPILPFLAEEVYQNIPFLFGFAGQESIHLVNYSPILPPSPDSERKAELITDFFLPLRQDVYQTLEKTRQEKELLLVAEVEIRETKEEDMREGNFCLVK
ncbi:9889_t:CDS:2, partial [Ambispora leptoticha]